MKVENNELINPYISELFIFCLMIFILCFVALQDSLYNMKPNMYNNYNGDKW